MPFIYLFFLAVTQGITEFLPISSSSHLILVAKFFNITGRSLTLDVAMHVGTLGAVLMYLWRDIAMIVIGIFNRFRGIKSHGSTLFFWLVIGTMPVLGAGYILNQVYQYQQFLYSLQNIRRNLHIQEVVDLQDSIPHFER